MIIFETRIAFTAVVPLCKKLYFYEPLFLNKSSKII